MGFTQGTALHGRSKHFESVLDLLKGVIPTITDWEVSPAAEMTDENKADFTVNGTGLAGYMVFDMGQIYFVKNLFLDLYFVLTSGVSCSQSFAINISSNGADWTALSTANSANNTVTQNGILNFYDNSFRYLKFSTGGAGATRTCTFHGRVIHAL